MGDKALRRKYQDLLKSDEVVFGGHALAYFDKMTAKELYAYKGNYPEFEKTWIFKAILQDRGPIFSLIATKGTDKYD